MANMWMVRAGEEGFLINDFKELNIVAIGWELDDLSSMSSDEIKQLMKEEYPEYNPFFIICFFSLLFLIFYLHRSLFRPHQEKVVRACKIALTS